GMRLGAVDLPNLRKVHTRPIPRSGGMAVFLAFLVTLLASQIFPTDISRRLVLDFQTGMFLAGAAIVFVTGVVDDFRRLGPKTKFACQIVAASLAHAGGLSILKLHMAFFSELGLGFQPISYLLTVFWFLLFINAVNLVDGLDGLAGGVAFFVSTVMVIMLTINGAYAMAMIFAALAGAVLGFLRYNFNPASIFLGDGGSYFLGFAIAGLAIMGSVKTQVSAAVLIPLVALGIPLFDTILSPIRRFIVGKRLFHPDKSHIHHKLISLGFSTRGAVLVIYSITVCLCLLAVVMVNLRDEKAGLFLVVLGGGAVFLVRKLGYFDYFCTQRIVEWIKDISDEAGIQVERRRFLNVQIEASRSTTHEELWTHITSAFHMLDFDYGSIYLNQAGNGASLVLHQTGFPGSNTPLSPPSRGESAGCSQRNKTDKAPGDHPRKSNGSNGNGNGNGRAANGNRRSVPPEKSSVILRERDPDWHWHRNPLQPLDREASRFLMRLELPLVEEDATRNHGTLVLLKDLRHGPLGHYALKRVEHLRRTVLNRLKAIDSQEGACTIPTIEAAVPAPGPTISRRLQ
ncbi:MAG: undecaprenyl/decaprenyl-phosphate alpha-N-acetylglucosaminyl 1-phosphate transferase, partial [Syntrophobacteraceae bacterium]|nr:undecaprenyl/decaprenyl-phosphate alpha-N-acetylglucosaminyl 1-phosphate transferase [Syntrophobacteraceae bacterium]